MSVPYPTVRCQNQVERRALHRELWALGFCRHCFPSVENAAKGFDGDGDYVTVGRRCQGADDEMNSCYTLVNSPAQMISYIKRHDLMPKI